MRHAEKTQFKFRASTDATPRKSPLNGPKRSPLRPSRFHVRKDVAPLKRELRGLVHNAYGDIASVKSEVEGGMSGPLNSSEGFERRVQQALEQRREEKSIKGWKSRQTSLARRTLQGAKRVSAFMYVRARL